MLFINEPRHEKTGFLHMRKQRRSIGVHDYRILNVLPNKEVCLAVKSVYIQETGRKCQFCTGVSP